MKVVFDSEGEKKIIDQLLNFGGDIGVAARSNWKSSYNGRTLHPVIEAENILLENGKILKIQKIMNLYFSPFFSSVRLFTCGSLLRPLHGPAVPYPLVSAPRTQTWRCVGVRHQAQELAPKQ